MEPFKIHILGCGSALPTLRHNPSAQVVEIREKQFLVDCGEGTQLQMRRSKIGFNRLCAVFISHIHGDHCFGLIGMLSSFGLLGRTMPLAIYAPKELKPVLDMLLETFCNDFDYEIQFHAVDTKKRAVIYEDRSLTVESIPLKHREPCAGFLFREKPTLPHIRRDMAIVLAGQTGGGCRVVLGSATPSLESWDNARRGKYGLVRLVDNHEAKVRQGQQHRRADAQYEPRRLGAEESRARERPRSTSTSYRKP